MRDWIDDHLRCRLNSISCAGEGSSFCLKILLIFLDLLLLRLFLYFYHRLLDPLSDADFIALCTCLRLY